LLSQRQADLDFHDILAAANPDAFLRFICQLINELLRKLVVFSTETPAEEHVEFGCANVRCHAAIAEAARRRDVEKVRELMREHMEEASSFVTRLNGRLDGRLILDSEMVPQLRNLDPR